MKAIIVDDEILMIKGFVRMSEDIEDLELAGKFNNGQDALDYAGENPVDIAFLDIEMPNMNGIDLAGELRQIRSDMMIVFITAHDQYVRESNEMGADYYLCKPYKREHLEMIMERMRLLAKRMIKKVSIRTFGRFEVFIADKPLVFPSEKAKELMALLVDQRGGVVNQEGAFALLWEGKAYNHNNAGIYRKTKKILAEALVDAGVGQVLYSLPHGMAINVESVNCDYFDFMSGSPEAIRSFHGIYMENYSWAEETCGRLHFMQMSQ